MQKPSGDIIMRAVRGKFEVLEKRAVLRWHKVQILVNRCTIQHLLRWSSKCCDLIGLKKRANAHCTGLHRPR